MFQKLIQLLDTRINTTKIPVHNKSMPKIKKKIRIRSRHSHALLCVSYKVSTDRVIDENVAVKKKKKRKTKRKIKRKQIPTPTKIYILELSKCRYADPLLCTKKYCSFSRTSGLTRNKSDLIFFFDFVPATDIVRIKIIDDSNALGTIITTILIRCLWNVCNSIRGRRC